MTADTCHSSALVDTCRRRHRADRGSMAGTPEAGERGSRFDDAMKAVADDDLQGLLAALPPTSAIDVSGGLAPLDRELGRSAVRPDLLARTGHVVVHGEYVNSTIR